MFSTRISYALIAVRHERRSEFEAALAIWSAWLRGRPGLRQLLMLEATPDEISAITVWDDASDYQAALADPAGAIAAAAFLDFVTGASRPRLPGIPKAA